MISGWSTIPTHCPGTKDWRCLGQCTINPETGVIRIAKCFPKDRPLPRGTE